MGKTSLPCSFSINNKKSNIKFNYGIRQVIVPTVECEDVADRTCVKLPNAEETTIDVTACVPVVDSPKCDKVNLVFKGWAQSDNLNKCIFMTLQLHYRMTRLDLRG